jgi:transcriptional regulator of met regulon
VLSHFWDPHWIIGVPQDMNHDFKSQINHWLVVSIPLKNMKVSWDDDYSQYMEKKKHVPNHQPDQVISS